MRPIALLLASLLALPPGCIWVYPAEYDARYADLTDADDDGVVGTAWGGFDCDDQDPEIHPEATETWYDGVDQDCAGDDDFDADADGHYPLAEGGDDCDDTDADVFPGAAETWYDSVDQDCAGDDDFDADADGFLAPEGGGTDCNDADATAIPPYRETLGDDQDGDCDGGNDTFRWAPFPFLMESTGIAGPVLVQNSTEVYLAWSSQTITDAYYRNPTRYHAVVAVPLDPADPWNAGQEPEYRAATYPAPQGTTSELVDFAVTDEFMAWTSGMVFNTGTRRLCVDVEHTNILDYAAAGRDDARVSVPFTGMDMSIDESGHIVATGMEPDTPVGWIISADAATLISSYIATRGADPEFTVTEFSGEGAFTDGAWRADESHLVLAADDGTLTTWTVEEGVGVSRVETLTGWTILDVDRETSPDGAVFAVSDAVQGVFVETSSRGGFTTLTEPLARIDVTSTSGTAVVCGATTDGSFTLLHGQPGALTEVSVYTGLDTVEECAVLGMADGTLLFAVRGGDEVLVATVTGG